MESINEFILTLDNIRVIEIADLVGYIYEELIPPEERHKLGQFYTPPAICELIAKWAIRKQDDLILDPGVGSGGFLLWAYRTLLKLKTGKDTLPASKAVVDATGHDAELLKVLEKKNPSVGLKLLGERSAYSELGETKVVETTGKVVDGLYVAGMAVAALKHIHKMGPHIQQYASIR